MYGKRWMMVDVRAPETTTKGTLKPRITLMLRIAAIEIQARLPVDDTGIGSRRAGCVGACEHSAVLWPRPSELSVFG